MTKTSNVNHLTLTATIVAGLVIIPTLLHAQTSDVPTRDESDLPTATEREEAAPVGREMPEATRDERTGGTEPSDDWQEPVSTRNNQERPFLETASNLAESDTARERIQTVQERQRQIEAEVKQRRAQAQAQGEERRQALQERAQERLLNLAANLSNRMEAAIRRLDNVVMRIESRIAKLNELGVETSQAEINLTVAKRDLASARATLANIDSDVAGFITSNDPRAAWSRVKTIYESARQDIRSAHTNIRQVVADLKEEMMRSEITDTEVVTEIGSE